MGPVKFLRSFEGPVKDRVSMPRYIDTKNEPTRSSFWLKRSPYCLKCTVVVLVSVTQVTKSGLSASHSTDASSDRDRVQQIM